jgi:hypothetical protein
MDRVRVKDLPDGHCEHCPVRGKGLACPRLASDHVRFCEWVDPTNPAHRPGVAGTLVALAARPVAAPVAGPEDTWYEEYPASSPSLAVRAGNLAAAAVEAVASGGKRATPEERERRLSICRGCEFFDADRVMCRQCGCSLSLKTRLDAWHCPLVPPKW